MTLPKIKPPQPGSIQGSIPPGGLPDPAWTPDQNPIPLGGILPPSTPPVPTPGPIPAVGQGALTEFGQGLPQAFQGTANTLGGGFYKGAQGEQIWSHLFKQGFLGSEGTIPEIWKKLPAAQFFNLFLQSKLGRGMSPQGWDYLLKAQRGELGKNWQRPPIGGSPPGPFPPRTPQQWPPPGWPKKGPGLPGGPTTPMPTF